MVWLLWMRTRMGDTNPGRGTLSEDPPPRVARTEDITRETMLEEGDDVIDS